MNEEKKYQSRIERKCYPCFRKDECMLFSARHAGIELCLGPFKDQEDRTKKIREDPEEKKPKADLDRAVREVVLNNYLRNKKLFDD